MTPKRTMLITHSISQELESGKYQRTWLWSPYLIPGYNIDCLIEYLYLIAKSAPPIVAVIKLPIVYHHCEISILDPGHIASERRYDMSSRTINFASSTSHTFETRSECVNSSKNISCIINPFYLYWRLKRDLTIIIVGIVQVCVFLWHHTNGTHTKINLEPSCS